MKAGIDHKALADLYANATQQQSAQLRQAVHDATVRALQGREFTLRGVRQVLDTVTQAVGAGILRNANGATDMGAMLASAVAGMDDAMLKAVEAQRIALKQFVDRGVDVRETALKKAMGDLDKMEDMLFGAIKRGAEMSTAGGMESLGAAWSQAMAAMAPGATRTGSGASGAAQQLGAQLDQARAMMRETRAAGIKAAQTLADSYATLVSGVLIGLSDALRQGSGGDADAGTAARADAPAPGAGGTRRR